MGSGSSAMIVRCPSCGRTHDLRGGADQVQCTGCGKTFRLADLRGRTVKSGPSVPAEVHADRPPTRRFARSSAVNPVYNVETPAALAATKVPVSGAACPHCGEAYPGLARFAGRKLRCRACRKAFLVQEGGSLIRLTSSGSVPTWPGEGAGYEASDAPSAPAAAPPDTATDAASSKASTERRQREAIVSMNATLARFAEEALKVVGGRKAGDHQSREGDGGRTAVSERLASARRTIRESGLHTARTEAAPAATEPGRPVLLNEGMRSGRRARLWIVSLCAGALCAGLLALLSAGRRDPLVEVLEKFAGGIDIGSFSREGRMKQAGLLGPQAVMPITGLSQARVAAVHSIDPGILLTALGDLVPLERGRIWIPGNELDHGRQVLRTPPEGKVPLTATDPLLRLRNAGLHPVLHTDLVLRLRGQGEDGILLADLVSAPPPAEGSPLPDAVAKLALGEWPKRIETAAFEGNDGILHLGPDRVLKVAYQGLMVRLIGPAWNGTWHVARLRAK